MQELILEFRRESLVRNGQVSSVIYRETVEHLAVKSHCIQRCKNISHRSVEDALVLVCYYCLISDP